MAFPGHLVDPLMFFPIALISLAVSIELALAQTTFSPISTGESGSVFVEGKAFYIQSGLTTTGLTQQTFSISLASSWNTAKPSYTKLPNGINDYRFPNTLLDDGVSWFAVSNKVWLTYNINTGAITQRAPLNTYSGLLGLSAVLDRVSGEVVIPNGNTDSAQTTTLYITPSSLATRSDSQPGVPSGLVRYSLAWSESAQKEILFGGVTTSGIYFSSFYQRNSSSGGVWSPITATAAPSLRESACMVPAFNGTKLILFGGSAPLDVPLSDVSIYDVAKNTWTAVSDGGPGRARSAHACAVSGDALIVWGGYSNSATRSPPANVLAVYNLTTNLWTDTYNAVTIKPIPTSISTSSISTPKPTSTTSSGSGSGNGTGNGTATGPGQDTSGSGSASGSGHNTGAIAGGVSAAVVIVLVGLGFVFWRRNRLKKDGNLSNDHHQQSEVGSQDYKEPVEKSKDPQGRLSVYPIPPPVNDSRHPQLDIPRHERQYHQKINEGFNDYRDPSERNRDPHAYLYVPPPPMPLQPPNDAQHLQLESSQRELENHQSYEGFLDYVDPVDRNRYPQANSNMQKVPPIPQRPAKSVRHQQKGAPRRERQHHQHSNEGYAYRDQTENNRDPHDEFNTGPTPRVVSWTVRSANARHPQLDVARRKQELALEMQLLEDATGNASPSARHSDR
ncbi:hypothetical protein CPB97_009781, partial [Podila verticillata]